MTKPPGSLLLRSVQLLLCTACLVTANYALAADPKKTFDVPAGDAIATLRQAAQQAGVEIMFPAANVSDIRTNPVSGEMTAREALNRMVAGTELVVLQDEKTGALAVRRDPDPNGQRAAQDTKPSDRPQKSKIEDGLVKLDTFEVMDSKLLNMDKPRSRNDVQPYVVFDRTLIENSGANSIEDFLKDRLPMNSQALNNNQTSGASGNTSQINLRGLGTNQTLILVDGHRVINSVLGATLIQADLNGIPVAAIERIEVLPTTSSGIYGGGATGGVVNVILRRNYSGAELRTTYDNTFRNDAAIRTIQLSAGFTLEGGKTNVLIAGSWSDQNKLLTQDRDFALRGRSTINRNNPAALLPPNTPLLGATPNIRSTSGGNLVLDNGTPLNSLFTFVPVGYAGFASDNGAALVANAGRYNFDLANTAQSTGLMRSIVGNPTVESLTATIRRQFSANFQAFLEISATNNYGEFTDNVQARTFSLAAAAASNPFQQPISITVPTNVATGERRTDSYDRRVVGGVIVKLPAGWQAEGDYMWNRARWTTQDLRTLNSAGAAAVSSGSLQLVRDTNSFPVDFSPYLIQGFHQLPLISTLEDISLRTSGPINVSLPGGPVTLSGLVEHRDEFFDASRQVGVAENLDVTFPSKGQKIDSVYFEMRIPIFGAGNVLSGARQLELQIAGRYDRYEIEGATSFTIDGTNTPVVRRKATTSSTNPTIGIKWQPTESITIRTSYGKGYLPPSVNQVLPVPNVFTETYVDSRRGGTSVALAPGQVINGGNPDVRPENSESWSAGIILTPSFVPDLRLSVDYTRIEKTDNISTFPGGTQALIDNESLVSGRVTRGPNLPGDLPGWAGPITTVNASLLNLARARVEAYDVAIDWRKSLHDAGAIEFFGAATWTTHYKTKILSTAPEVENVGITSNNPLKLKGNVGIVWNCQPWSVGWTTRYFDSYLVSTNATTRLNQGNAGRVPRQIYHDVFVRFQFGNTRSRESATESGWALHLLRNTDVQVGIKNVFNKAPPFDAARSPDYYSPLGDARLAAYYVTVRKTF